MNHVHTELSMIVAVHSQWDALAAGFFKRLKDSEMLRLVSVDEW